MTSSTSDLAPHHLDPAWWQRPAEERLPEWALTLTSRLDDRLGLVIGELTAERCTGRAPVEGNTQPFGMWHGGASGVVVETLGSFAANAHGQQFGKGAVGVDLNVTHVRAARKGHVIGVATPLHLGRSVVTHLVNLYDDDARLIASGRLTCQLVSGLVPTPHARGTNQPDRGN